MVLQTIELNYMVLQTIEFEVNQLLWTYLDIPSRFFSCHW